jgi:hypothetical protein
MADRPFQKAAELVAAPRYVSGNPFAVESLLERMAELVAEATWTCAKNKASFRVPCAEIAAEVERMLEQELSHERR